MSGFTELQIVRWAIPGWTMLVTFLILELEDGVFFRNLSPLLRVIQVGGGTPSGSSSNLVAILVGTVAGIPLGYLIYQVYFFFRWNWCFSSRGMLPPFVRRLGMDMPWLGYTLSFLVSFGRLGEINGFLGDGEDRIRLVDLDSKRAKAKEMDAYMDRLSSCSRRRPCFLCGDHWSKPETDHRRIWALLETVWLRACLAENGQENSPLVRRSRSLFDTFHGLGAARVALILGYFLYLSHLWYQDRLRFLDPEALMSPASIAVNATLLGLLTVLSVNRNDVMLRIESLWHSVLRDYKEKTAQPAFE